MINPLGGSFRHRSKKENAIIKDGEKDFTIQREEVTEFLVDGSAETTVTVISQIGGAERIFTPMQIIGKCELCQGMVTVKTARYCQCGLSLCIKCSKWWEDERRPVCPGCYKKLRRKRFLRVILSLFMERREDGPR